MLKPPVTDNQPNQLANLQPPLAADAGPVVRAEEPERAALAGAAR
ncbi:hypothetical protein ACFV4Q_06295 [Streptomyces nojiriensis]